MKKKMDDRKFLQIIRDLEKKGKKVGLTEISFDKNGKKLLTESDDEIGVVYNLDEQNDEYITSDEQRQEEVAFKDNVSKLVKFDKITVKKENVEWSGKLTRENIQWTYSLDETVGCYIKTEDFIQLKDEHIKVIQKIRAYYDIWSDNWASRLTGADEEENEEF
jgi:hypothetical protein